MKFNHKVLLIPALVGSVIMTGCKKDYLESKPSEFISSDQLIEASKLDPNLLNGNIGGLYTTMYITGTGGTTGHDDFGQKGYDIFTDMLSGDMVLGAVNYGWYSTIARFQASTDFTRTANYMPWRYYYRVIFGANIVLDALGGANVDQTETTKRHIAGQALAMRAYGYFYLSQFYSRKGYGDGTEKIIPIYTDTKQPNQPKSTQKEVWDLMVSDLTRSVEYLDDFVRDSKDKVDKTVAKGLLAYVLAARGTNADLQQVITLSNDIIDAFPLTTKSQSAAVLSGGVLQNPESGFNNVATPSWVWGVDLTLASGLDLISWWGQVDYYTYSYAWAGDPKTIDRNLQNAIRPDDVRRTQFHSTGRPLYKFFAPGRVAGGQRYITTDYVYMRADEFQLLKAEAYARLNQDQEARDALKVLASIRITDISYIDALAGQALKDEIYFQTRLEFWGEGKAYLAMKRNQKPVTRGPNHLYFANQTYQYDAAELSFPIPQAEVLNNPVLNN